MRLWATTSATGSGLEERHLKLGQYLFRQHGGKVVFFGRFVSILRTWAAFLAGVNRMRWRRFLLFNASGGILWATIFGVGGFALGDQLTRLSRPADLVLGAIAAATIVAFVVFVRRNEERLSAEAERAMPGPLDEARRQDGVRLPRSGR